MGGGKGLSLETRRASMAERCFHAADVTCFEQVWIKKNICIDKTWQEIWFSLMRSAPRGPYRLFRRETSPFVFFAHAIRISRSNFLRERERDPARRWKPLKLTEDRSKSNGWESVWRIDRWNGVSSDGWVCAPRRLYRGVEWHFAKIAGRALMV